jgi:hypothetical protein
VQQLRLRAVGVLELVDQDVAGLRPCGLEPVRMRPQQRQRAQQRLAEVLQPGLGQPRVVELVDACELQVRPRPPGRRRAARAPERFLGVAAEGGRRHQLVLAAVDAVAEAGHHVGRVAAQVVLHQLQLGQAIEQEQGAVVVGRGNRRRQQPALDPVGARELHRVGVEGGHPQRLVGHRERLLRPAPQLLGRARREREREHLAGRRPPVHEPGEPAAEDARLAGARAGHHEEGSAGVGDGGALVRRELVEHRLDGRCGPGRVPTHRGGVSPGRRPAPPW